MIDWLIDWTNQTNYMYLLAGERIKKLNEWMNEWMDEWVIEWMNDYWVILKYFF